MTQGRRDQIFVWSYIDTGYYQWESWDMYSPEPFGLLHYALATLIDDQLREIRAAFGKECNLAEYPDVEEELEESEKPVFLKAAGAPDDCTPDPDNAGWMGEYDSFRGLRAVIRHRLHEHSPEQLKKAVELFNYTSEYGLFYCDPPAPALIKIGTAVDLAPFLLERILNRLPADGNMRDAPSAFDRDFLPLARVLAILKEEIVGAPNWVENDLPFRLFIYIAGLYRDSIQGD